MASTCVGADLRFPGHPLTCNDRRLHRDLHDAVQEVVEHGYTHFMTVEGDGACFYRAVLMGAILAAHGARSNSRRASMLDRLDAMADAVSGESLGVIVVGRWIEGQ